eukprot:gene13116-14464_t
MHWLTGIANLGEGVSELPDDTSKKRSIHEESWTPGKERKSFQKTEKESAKENGPIRRASSGFKNFRKNIWNDLAAASASYKVCTDRLERLWQNMPDNEKEI